MHGNNPEEVMRDREGVQLTQTVGRNMAWLMKTLQESTVARPQPVERVVTNFTKDNIHDMDSLYESLFSFSFHAAGERNLPLPHFAR